MSRMIRYDVFSGHIPVIDMLMLHPPSVRILGAFLSQARPRKGTPLETQRNIISSHGVNLPPSLSACTTCLDRVLLIPEWG